MRNHLGATLAALALCSGRAAGQTVITTFAGGGPDDVPAVAATVESPVGVAVDAAGNIFFGAHADYTVYKVDPSGHLSVVAGMHTSGFGGDGGPGRSAFLGTPFGIALDSAGNLYIADVSNHRVRRVDAVTGFITTVAGTGVAGYNGDGIPATTAQLSNPSGIAVDAAGNLYITEANNHRVRKVAAASGVITTVAGTIFGFAGDGGPATGARLNTPLGVTVDAAGNLFISDTGNRRVRKVATTGIITTVAGTGATLFNGDGIAATSANINSPVGLSVDAAGNLFIATGNHQRIRKVALTGIITTVAGTGVAGYNGDGIAATAARLAGPAGVVVDATGKLVIADSANNRVRTVTGGIIATKAGNGFSGYSGDGGISTLASLANPQEVAVDSSGNVIIADSANHRIRRVNLATGLMTTVAGTGIAGFSGDGGPATSAALLFPADAAVDSAGNVFIADSNNNRIRKVAFPSGTITTVAGTGAFGFSGDTGPATSARLGNPVGVAVDASGNLFIADTSNHRIRRVDSGSGIITTVAGSGFAAFGGDGGPATSAHLNVPAAVAVGAGGTLLIADSNNNRIRRVDGVTQIITTFAGSGVGAGFADGPVATARLNGPAGVTLDAAGNVFIADQQNNRIRKVSSGMVTTVAGTGVFGFFGDGGPPTSARLAFPRGVAVDAAGTIYIADQSNDRIRRIGESNQAPVAVCGDPTVPADENCQASISVDNGSYDPDGGPNPISVSQAPPGPYGLGPTSVQLTVDDGAAAAMCSATVTVFDATFPLVVVPADLGRECTSPAGAQVAFAAEVSDNCEIGSQSCSPASESVFSIGSTGVACTATDTTGNEKTAGFNVNVVDTTRPTISGPGPIDRECTSAAGALVTYSVTADDICSTPTVGCSHPSGSVFPLGTTAVGCKATDGSHNTAEATPFNVTVRDTTRPTISVPSDITMECTNPGGADVPFGVSGADACTTTPTISCSHASGSLFPVGGPTPVSCTVTDGSGNFVTGAFGVTVTSTPPMLTALLGDPLVMPIGTEVDFSASFWDNLGDEHSATWDFGDASPLVAVASATSPLLTSYEYAAPGVFKAIVEITDRCGNKTQDSVVVVVFDPADGFTTGGGWFVPDSDSFIDQTPVTDTSSKANFGFIVKYKKGQSSPHGNLEFQYKAGSINLKSTQMDWMVISANRVRFKGLATINGQGQYTFKVTADDNGEPGTNDTFRIEIWTGVQDTENGPNPKTMTKGTLGGGNIQIHK